MEKWTLSIDGGVQNAQGEHVRTPEHGAPCTPQNAQVNTPEISVLQVKLEASQQQVADRDKELAHRDDTISDLRTRLDHSEAKRDEAQTKLTALLTDQRTEAAQKRVERPTARAGFLVALVLVVVVLAVVGAFLWFGSVGIE